MIAVEELTPRCPRCGSMLPRPDFLPRAGFGFNGLERSSDDAFIERRALALSAHAVSCGDCGQACAAYFWKEQSR